MPTGNITGFSLMHESGTGGSPKYGTVSQFPLPTNSSTVAKYSVSRAAADAGSVGYYKSTLSGGIIVELAGTEHAGFYQYTYPIGQGANILVDVSHYLPSNRPGNFSQHYSNGKIQVFPDGHYEGSGTYNGGWNLSPDWTVYFCGRFSEKPKLFKTFIANAEKWNVTEMGKNDTVSSRNRVGAIFSFSNSTISSRVGVSFTSTIRACQYVDSEIPPATRLPDLVQKSKDIWNTKVLSRLTTSESNQAFLGQLYSSMYGTFLLPSNRTADVPGVKWNPDVPYYDDIYTLWDLYRSSTPLWHVLQPEMYSEFLQSIVEVARVDGYLPDGRSSFYNGRVQGGSSADNILADAYVKGVKPQFSYPIEERKKLSNGTIAQWTKGRAARTDTAFWLAAYDFMVKDAETVPPNETLDPSAPDSSTRHGRGALDDWINRSFISETYTRSVSRAVEYSGNDFALSQVAAGMGRHTDAEKYLARSRNWRHHWDPNVTSYGNVKGFLMPKHADGSFFKGVDPTSCGGCYWGDAYYEATPWQYTLNVPHDINTLVRFSGGEEGFAQRLAQSLLPSVDTVVRGTVPDKNMSTPVVDFGNEPSFGTSYLFHYINMQDESVMATRAIAQKMYKPGPSGLPGNSDAGAIQSWWLWNVLGLYPVTGQNVFLLGVPWTQNFNITYAPGKQLVILADGYYKAGSTPGGGFISSVALNGKNLTNNWLTYQDLFNGEPVSTLHFQLSETASQWDKAGIPPPSPASASNMTGIAVSLLLQQAKQSRDLAIGVGVGTTCLALLVILLAMLWACWRRRDLPMREALGLKRKKTDEEADDKQRRRQPQMGGPRPVTTTTPRRPNDRPRAAMPVTSAQPDATFPHPFTLSTIRELDDDEKTLTGDPEIESRMIDGMSPDTTRNNSEGGYQASSTPGQPHQRSS
jgi:predicted alpha-1,2-mannosidase